MSVEIGRVVRRGKIRVDARKAITKLRDHLLVDLHLYAIEVVRAAFLAGASRVDVTYDADDVIVAFDGRALDPAELPRLFEHLTVGDEGEEGRFPRLLALAVNAALGLAPAWISVTAASGGAAARVVWTPALVHAIEHEERPLPEPEEIARPSDMPATGTRFHLRRKVGWEVVRRAAAREPPREVTLLLRAAVCPRAPLFVNGEPAAPPRRADVLARSPMRLPGARAAHVEITGTIDTAPHVDFCEQGLLLARASLAFGRHFPMAEHAGVSPPVRVVVDADALPTNASRSAVREDATLFTSLAGAAAPALGDAIAGVAASLFGRGSAPEGVTVLASDRAALEDALGAFLCAAEASITARVPLPDALRALLDLPLFRDGLGRPLGHGDIPRDGALLIWTGKEPVPREMEPWASAIVWRSGRVAERLLSARVAMEPAELAEVAKRGATRHRQLLATPAGEPAVPDDAHLGRERFSFREGPLAGLSGEVAVAASAAGYVRNMGLRVFLQGRCYQTFPIPEDTVPLPCLIALEWPGQIRPRFAYDGVEANAGLRGALAYAVRAAVLICERLALARAREGQALGAQEAAILRGALATAVLAPARMFSLQGFEMPALTGLPGLVRAPVWPTADDRLVSLHDLGEHAAITGAVCVVAPGTRGSAPDGRPVVRASAIEVEHLARCLHPKVKLVRYDAALRSGAEEARRFTREQMTAYIQLAAGASRSPVLRLEAPGKACFVTLGQSELRVWHGGAEVAATPLDASLGGVTIALDDDSVVPDERWDRVLFSADQAIAGHAERTFAARLVAALLGDERARGELRQGASGLAAAPYPWPADLRELPSAVRRYLIDRAARGRAADAGDADREAGARIEMLPLLTMISPGGAPAPASLSDVERTHRAPGKIPWLRLPPTFRPVRWQPVIEAADVILDALSRWSDGRAEDARGELAAQEKASARELEYIDFLKRPKVDGAVVGPRGDLEGPTVHLAAPDGILGVAASLPAAGADITHALVEVTFEDRVVCELIFTEVPIPLVARVSLSDREALDGFDRLSPRGRHSAAERARHAAAPLALAVLERACRPGGAPTLFGDARALSLLLAVLANEPRGMRIEQALRGDAMLWPTVQGGGRPWSQLRHTDDGLWAGTVAYASWIAASPASDLDRPILYVPPSREGSVLAGILAQLGVKIRAVSDAVAALQARRAKGATDTLRLAERPAHPLLARELDKLLGKGLDGEIGLFESGEAVAEIHTLEGETKRIPLDVPFPARAVARTELITREATAIAADRISRSAVLLLIRLAGKLDELPSFVRAHLRAYVCRLVSKDQHAQTPARAARIFPDVDGRWWSLDQLTAKPGGDWSCTFDPPPYPRHRQEGTTLVLTPAEHLQLQSKVKILNVTEWMRRDLEGERRREGPQVAEVRFDAAARAHMMASFEVKDGSLEGEIGLLLPASDGARGVQVFVTRRPVYRVDDAPGWPVAAVLNDDSLHPNRWFTEIRPAEETALRSRVRRLVSDHLHRTLLAALPAGRRAEVFLDRLVPPVAAYGSTEPMSVTGYLYLPSSWPVTPSVRLWVQGHAGPVDHAIEQAAAPIHAILPIGGVLFVSHREPAFGRSALHRLALMLRAEVERLLAPLVRQAPDDPELLAYHWNVRLLGGTMAGSPTTTAADGETVTADHVLSALDHGEIWVTDRRGSIDGAFPDGAPPFVLRNEASPLLRVLRARLPAARFRALGGLDPREAEATLAPPSAPPAEIADLTAPAAPESKRTPARSWLGAVIDRVSGVFGARPSEAPPPTEIGPAVERALRALRLRDEPVIVVKEVRRGRLLRYDAGDRVVTINVAHPALAPIAAAPSPASVRRACLALTAAALSEVNIALSEITDHDESEALLELLRQDAAAAAQAQARSPSAEPRGRAQDA